MMLVALLAILSPVAATPPNPVPPSNTPVLSRGDRQRCERPGARRIGDVPPPGARKLGDMPPAKPIYTVLREIDGCPIPVSVRAR